MTQDAAVWEFDPIKILLVGAGGIGSQLAYIVVPALKELLSVRWRAWRSAEESIENPIRPPLKDNNEHNSFPHYRNWLQLFFMDSDVIEERNLTHQRFFPEDVGQPKVKALVNRLQPFVQDSNLKLSPVLEDLTELNSKILEKYDFVIVAVDNSEARQLVHEHAERWIDLRCGGDGYTCYDDSSDAEFVSQMTPPDQLRSSCQQPGALEVANIEMGYAMAAAHGAQWLIQSVRQKMGVSTHPPQPRTYSLTSGELNLEPVTERWLQSPNHGKRWTSVEIKQLNAEKREGRTIISMAESQGRTPRAIEMKLNELSVISSDVVPVMMQALEELEDNMCKEESYMKQQEARLVHLHTVIDSFRTAIDSITSEAEGEA